jgi:hypothetical protein
MFLDLLHRFCFWVVLSPPPLFIVFMLWELLLFDCFVVYFVHNSCNFLCNIVILNIAFLYVHFFHVCYKL